MAMPLRIVVAASTDAERETKGHGPYTERPTSSESSKHTMALGRGMGASARALPNKRCHIKSLRDIQWQRMAALCTASSGWDGKNSSSTNQLKHLTR